MTTLTNLHVEWEACTTPCDGEEFGKGAGLKGVKEVVDPERGFLGELGGWGGPETATELAEPRVGHLECPAMSGLSQLVDEHFRDFLQL